MKEKRGSLLDEKKRTLEELKRARSKATCSTVVSSKIDVQRETRIEELEEEIAGLEKGL